MALSERRQNSERRNRPLTRYIGRITYLREWCALPDEEEYTGGQFGDLSTTLKTAIINQEEEIISRSRAMLKAEEIADPFLFHALADGDYSQAGHTNYYAQRRKLV